jgi:hypothetical protein
MKYKPRTSRPSHCFQHWKRKKLSVSLPAKPYDACFFCPTKKWFAVFCEVTGFSLVRKKKWPITADVPKEML